MKTTLDFEGELKDKLVSLTKKTGLPLEEVVERAVRLGLEKMNPSGPIQKKPYQQRTYNIGIHAGVNIDKALALAAEIEDEKIDGVEISRR
ncbi:MAG TPA: hypothetical protein VH413_15660 [Verrucomicrobiae bacterium]|jgi:hypothetical protein|nr:hypothetical protein [Verrucomicrobiae bacterium]